MWFTTDIMTTTLLRRLFQLTTVLYSPCCLQSSCRNCEVQYTAFDVSLLTLLLFCFVLNTTQLTKARYVRVWCWTNGRPHHQLTLPHLPTTWGDQWPHCSGRWDASTARGQCSGHMSGAWWHTQEEELSKAQWMFMLNIVELLIATIGLKVLSCGLFIHPDYVAAMPMAWVVKTSLSKWDAPSLEGMRWSRRCCRSEMALHWKEWYDRTGASVSIFGISN